jgi:hypothetical protein
VTLPPHGGRTKAHLHENHETALYLISGDEAELWTGEQLEHMEVAHPGDYIYIPAGVPHVAVNRTETPMAFIAARTDPNEQESVVMRPDLEGKGALALVAPLIPRPGFSQRCFCACPLVAAVASIHELPRRGLL